jgi:hypothetical protein
MIHLGHICSCFSDLVADTVGLRLPEEASQSDIEQDIRLRIRSKDM